MFLIGSFTNPGSRVPNDGRRVDTGQRKPERKSRRIVESQVATKGRHRRALPQGYFGYGLGRRGNPPTTQNTPGVEGHRLYYPTGSLRQIEAGCQQKGCRDQRVDRCHYHFILFSTRRQKHLAKFHLFHEIIGFFLFSFFLTTVLSSTIHDIIMSSAGIHDKIMINARNWA